MRFVRIKLSVFSLLSFLEILEPNEDLNSDDGKTQIENRSKPIPFLRVLRILRFQIKDDGEDLSVFGFEVKLFPNDPLNNEGPCMIGLPYDEGTEVDRYDCRLLLHSRSQIGEARERDDVPDFEEEYLCEEERYLDLVNPEDEQKPSTSMKPTEIPFNYGEPSSLSTNAGPPPAEAFRPPKKQHYPSGMILVSLKI